jgi:hypothetical protein
MTNISSSPRNSPQLLLPVAATLGGQHCDARTRFARVKVHEQSFGTTTLRVTMLRDPPTAPHARTTATARELLCQQRTVGWNDYCETQSVETLVVTVRTGRNRMKSTVRIAVAVAVLAALAAPAVAQDQASSLANQAAEAAAQVAPQQEQQGSAPPAVAVEYSDAYRMRAKVHKIASFATLPLFAAEGVVGQKLYNARINFEDTSTLKSTHLALAGGIGALFGVNTVTGVWNLIESRHDPNHRTIKWVHGLLMLGADAGFLATAATGPGDDERFFATDTNGASTHRAIAFTSIGAATTGYLIMLFGSH